MRRLLLALPLLAVPAWLFACSSFGGEDTPAASDAGPDGATVAASDADAPACSTITPGAGPPPLHPEGGITTDCDGTTFDLETSQKNCGTCGRVCSGGACVNGACATTELAAKPTDWFAVYGVSDGQIVFGNTYEPREIFAIPVTGGARVTMWSALDVTDGGVAVPVRAVVTSENESWVAFLGDANYLQSLTVSGARGPLVPLGTTEIAEGNAVAVGGELFALVDAGGLLFRKVVHLDKLTGTASPVASSEPHAASLTSRGSAIFWAREPRFWGEAGDGVIGRYDTSSTSTRYSVPANPRGRLAADDAFIYYFDEAAREFRRLPQDLPDGAQPETLARWNDPDVDVASMRVSGDYVYAGLGAERKYAARVIVRIPRCGGEPVVVARDDTNANILGFALLGGRLVFGESSKLLSTEP